jgi:AcrR family transcriptional regulator
MGHREDLLAGAKRCIHDKGYAGTTARDIVAASGANLASIGYHFGSKDALMQAALLEAVEDWGDEVARILALDTHDQHPLERFEAVWTAVTESFVTHRQLWASSFEVWTQASRSEVVQQFLTQSLELGRTGLVALFCGGEEPEPGSERARTLGSLLQAMMSGVIVQWLIDPESAPRAKDLVAGARALATDLFDDPA